MKCNIYLDEDSFGNLGTYDPIESLVFITKSGNIEVNNDFVFYNNISDVEKIMVNNSECAEYPADIKLNFDFKV